jgi:hypothetical protein
VRAVNFPLMTGDALIDDFNISPFAFAACSV